MAKSGSKEELRVMIEVNARSVQWTVIVVCFLHLSEAVTTG